MFHAAFKVSFSHIQIILKEVRMIRVAIVDDHAVAARSPIKATAAPESLYLGFNLGEEPIGTPSLL